MSNTTHTKGFDSFLQEYMRQERHYSSRPWKRMVMM